MRLRNNANAMNELIESKILISDFPLNIDNNTVIELGMGKGEMIVELARKNPTINFIGIEKYATVAARAAKIADQMEIKNFKIICEDIISIPKMFVGKVDLIWLTFCDPWPKNRHEKRRLTHINFLNIYKEILTNDGVLKFKTDNDKLFDWSVEHIKEHNIKLFNITKDFHTSNYSKGNIMTGYEKKWAKQGKTINYLEIKF
ncbi:tRNA (guanosine(46)-N7)-methyltransferase TrmB [Candidatus Mycoplasma mahonii]|uniref:tRNA (guanosine(46)-N7)-methyltransferase TrmB n=1 Tax=Candidatus Mycoplasma mahonii TaxID=3004105 RepID=UPI0026F0126D|nr:tRNA (guanosine(46)-N7)-methyltransferase TrmB [Candidatus Mycoplasma mahonii]WKX02580.1 tRNA (guanosine(46)-N7)-methyltransferase TrmB [Candidatus Mycoplasma mahonii]